jgi:hypothetical protein
VKRKKKSALETHDNIKMGVKDKECENYIEMKDCCEQNAEMYNGRLEPLHFLIYE